MISCTHSLNVGRNDRGWNVRCAHAIAHALSGINVAPDGTGIYTKQHSVCLQLRFETIKDFTLAMASRRASSSGNTWLIAAFSSCYYYRCGHLLVLDGKCQLLPGINPGRDLWNPGFPWTLNRWPLPVGISLLLHWRVQLLWLLCAMCCDLCTKSCLFSRVLRAKRQLSLTYRRRS